MPAENSCVFVHLGALHPDDLPGGPACQAFVDRIVWAGTGEAIPMSDAEWTLLVAHRREVGHVLSIEEVDAFVIASRRIGADT